ncbi:hypothetical protein BRM22_21270 [Xanthomonas oryzae pv. oryzae]|uniref:Uncharacterized protein n=1 Tax=Xanthomonas oryzae pv. oryzae TaxID=64187 RepID=A0A854CNZ0_XANOO|nr:hypothetical protein BXO2_18805 [Xanthomonas oryzae pv. oryzae]OLG38785.1 hypothetical protein BXO6_00275 [Xanthomonas oryzae pv. oryzae]OLG45186.1 hypothetical protein BXO33_10200 [Xanthomonas oryzae pv. oryzae]OLG46940.1 hypothetical protein BXO25_09390 [Xanthomonas oryzae pv. oryzae]OLG52770.1 hypothetical protein BXO34_16900 [Xanthomonas oryzae pv. oryzae]
MQDGLYRQRPRIARPLFFLGVGRVVLTSTSVQATAKMLLCDNNVIRGDALDFHHVPAHVGSGAFH